MSGKKEREKRQLERIKQSATTAAQVMQASPIWYRDNLFWGPFGSGLALVLAAIALPYPTLRLWMLIVAWGLFSTSFWVMFRRVGTRRTALALTVLLSFLTGGSLFLLRPPAMPVFSIRRRAAIITPDFPSPVVYKYGEPPNVFLAPVAIAIVIEVINNRSTKTEIEEYFADFELQDGKQVRIFSLPMSPPHEVYYLNGRDIHRGLKSMFQPPVMFDEVAAKKTLDPGEKLWGWMFFEWSKELRTSSVSAGKLKITMKNSQDETAEAVFDLDPEKLSKAEEAGASMLRSNQFGGGGAEEEDLSGIPIRPFRE